MFATDDLEEKILKRIPLEIFCGGILLALATLPLFGPISALAVFVGGGVSAIGFLWMKSTLTRILRSGRGAALRKAFLIYGLRLVLILAIFLIIILWFPGKILAFAAGFSVLVPVFLIEGAVAIWRMKSWKN